ncbi:MAG: hypothetical protein Kow0054_31730 [Deferrisoma sp.]
MRARREGGEGLPSLAPSFRARKPWNDDRRKGTPMSDEQEEVWTRLIRVAVEVKTLAPWRWMDEAQVFGVVDPDTGEHGYVSVMGTQGEHLAMAVYRGPVGLLGFSRMQNGEIEASPELFFEIPQLQMSFEDRSLLERADRDLLVERGFRFRGRQAWPLFRAYRPGWEPCLPTEAEARFLAAAGEQLLDVARRLQDDPSILFGPSPDALLHRVARRRKGALVWSDRYMPPPEFPETRIPIAIDGALVEAVERLPVGIGCAEVEAGLAFTPVGPRRGERFFPVLLVVADQQSGAVIHVDTFEPLEPYEYTYGEIPESLFEGFLRVGRRPRAVRVRPGLTAGVLRAVAQGIPWLRVEVVEAVPAAQAAREGMIEFLQQRSGRR